MRAPCQNWEGAKPTLRASQTCGHRELTGRVITVIVIPLFVVGSVERGVVEPSLG